MNFLNAKCFTKSSVFDWVLNILSKRVCGEFVRLLLFLVVLKDWQDGKDLRLCTRYDIGSTSRTKLAALVLRHQVRFS